MVKRIVSIIYLAFVFIFLNITSNADNPTCSKNYTIYFGSDYAVCILSDSKALQLKCSSAGLDINRSNYCNVATFRHQASLLSYDCTYAMNFTDTAGKNWSYSVILPGCTESPKCGPSACDNYNSAGNNSISALKNGGGYCVGQNGYTYATGVTNYATGICCPDTAGSKPQWYSRGNNSGVIDQATFKCTNHLVLPPNPNNPGGTAIGKCSDPANKSKCLCGEDMTIPYYNSCLTCINEKDTNWSYAYGCVSTSLNGGLANSIARIFYGIAGGLMMLKLMRLGISLIYGNDGPDKIKDNKAEIVAVGIGMVFLALSLIVFRYIGFDILGLNDILKNFDIFK